MKKLFPFLIFILVALSASISSCTYSIRSNFETMNANMIDSIYFDTLYEDSVCTIDWTKDWVKETKDLRKVITDGQFLKKNVKSISAFIDTLKKYTIYNYKNSDKRNDVSIAKNGYNLNGRMVFYYTARSEKILLIMFNSDLLHSEYNSISYNPLKPFPMRDIMSPGTIYYDINCVKPHIKKFIFLMKEELEKK